MCGFYYFLSYITVSGTNSSQFEHILLEIIVGLWFAR